jgi:hypothetical protein
MCSNDRHFQSSAFLHTTSIPDWPKCPLTFLYIRRIHSSREPEAASFSETAEQQTQGAITVSIRQPINIDILPFGWRPRRYPVVVVVVVEDILLWWWLLLLLLLLLR